MICKQKLMQLLNRCTGQLIRTMSTCEPEANSAHNDVIFECRNKRGIITLNKPKSLNAINYPMVCKITEKLEEWENALELVIIKGNGKAFCSGGDVVDITRDGPCASHKGKQFFKYEYLMNNLIGTYKIPYIAIIDGITMGGGLGLSVHGRFRVATENTLCAMPETNLGLYPDVGGTYFLPRLPGCLGIYLGLTGYRLKGTDVTLSGIATHYCPSSKIPQLYDALVNTIDPSKIEQEIMPYVEDTSSAQFSLATKRLLIDKIFALDSIESIMKALEKEGSDWSLKTLAILKKMSPLSLKLTLEAVNRGKQMSLQECLQMEYRMSHTILDAKISCDFYEGVRALLIDKDKKPQWHPKLLEDITAEMVECYFASLNADEELPIQ